MLNLWHGEVVKFREGLKSQDVTVGIFNSRRCVKSVCPPLLSTATALILSWQHRNIGRSFRWSGAMHAGLFTCNWQEECRISPN